MAELPLPPGSTIGILGGGQLGRMLALAAARLGFDVAVLEREADSPAGRVSAQTIVGGSVGGTLVSTTIIPSTRGCGTRAVRLASVHARVMSGGCWASSAST